MPGFKGVRVSKFRHVFGSPFQKEKCYEGLNITDNAHDSNFCAVNPKFLAVVLHAAGGGTFTVIPLKKVGRIDSSCPRISGHTGPVLDIKWSPFDDHMIASCADDGLIKFWEIPENGLVRTKTEPEATLSGHSRKVTFIEWHPTASNIIASIGYDNKIIVWDADNAEQVCVISCHTNVIYSMAWSWNGSTIVTSCKDKKLRLIDPRSGSVLKENCGHYSVKPFKVMFTGQSDLIITSGFVSNGVRQITLWNKNYLDKPIATVSVDTGSSSIFPFFDGDSMILFLAGKGDGTIRYYEVTEEAPYLHYLSQHFSRTPHRGIGSMPKRGLDTSLNEIMRFYRVCTVKNLIEPVSMVVPRRSDFFQPDIYPDTPGNEPALTSDEWTSGIDRDPILMSFGGGSRPKALVIEGITNKKPKESKIEKEFEKQTYTQVDVEKVEVKKSVGQTFKILSPKTSPKPSPRASPKASPVGSPRASPKVGFPRTGSPLNLSEVSGNRKGSNENINQDAVVLSPREAKKKLLTDRFLASVEERKVSSKSTDSDLTMIPKKHDWKSEESLPRSPSTEYFKFDNQTNSSIGNDSEDGQDRLSPDHNIDTEETSSIDVIKSDETGNAGSTQSRINAWTNQLQKPSSPQTSPKQNGRVQRQNTSTSFSSAMSLSEIPTAEIRPRVTSQEKNDVVLENSSSPKSERSMGRVGSARARYAEEVDKRNRQLRKQRTQSQEVDPKELENTSQKKADKHGINRTQSLRQESELKTSSEFGVEQLRKAYLRQMDEIKQLKTQILLKDQRIKQLEKEISDSNN